VASGVGAFFLAGLAVMVRPANAAAAVAMFAVWSVGVGRRDVRALWRVPLLVVAFVLPFLPQLVNNYRISGKINPLLVINLFSDTRIDGVLYIKRATVHIPGKDGVLLHRNPFGRPELTRPGEFLRERPLGYVGTCLLHGLFLFDQDSPYTYVTNLKPWYRWPSSALSFAFLALALYGTALAAQRALRRRRLDRLTFTAAASLFLVAGYFTVYLTSHVKARYGVPLYLLLSAFLVLAVLRMRMLAAHARYVRLGLAALWLVGFVGLSCALSAWLDTYAGVVPLGGG
jgi:hypothetical protein